MSAELVGRSGSELAGDLAARRLRATEVVAACLARIDEVNPGLNAICTLDGEAALAAAVFSAAPEDPGAQAIIERGADCLADMAVRLVGRLGEPGPVVLAGGLLLHQPLLERAVRARLSAQGLTAIRLEDEPVVGAVRLAGRLLTAATAPETTP